MALQSGNVIPINLVPNQQGLLPDLCTQLNLLTEEYIYPKIPTLFPFLLQQLDDFQQTATNNQDVMLLLDTRNTLKKHASSLEAKLKSELTKIEPMDLSQDDDTPLKLLENDDLNHELLWISAAEKMQTDDNLQLIYRIKKRVEQAFPDFKAPIPSSGEKLCASFSNTLSKLSLDQDIEQKLLYSFAKHIQSEADKLWIEVNQLLDEIGIADIEKIAGRSQAVSASENESHSSHLSHPSQKSRHSKSNHCSPVKQSIANVSSTDDFSELTQALTPELMNSLAEKLALRVEDMLLQDEVIPEIKIERLQSGELATLLNGLQQEVTSQHHTIFNLAETVKTAVEQQQGHNKLSRRHEDLISLVGLLFEYILDDHQLPELVKKEIALLQIPILKLAIFDSDFLSDRQHPARLLLNEMSSAGMNCQKELVFTDPILLLIESTVRTIITESQDDLTIFSRSLESFRFEIALIMESIDEEKIESEDDQKQDDDPSLPESLVVDTIDNDTTFEFETSLPANMSETDYEEEIVLESALNDVEVTTISSQTEPSCHTPSLSEEENSQFVKPIEGIRQGQWVEFIGEKDSHRIRCKLTRINKGSNRYYFENRSGLRVAEYTGQQLQREIDQGSILILNDNLIFDRALHAVIEKFKRK